MGCRMGGQVLEDNFTCGFTEQTNQQQQCLLQASQALHVREPAWFPGSAEGQQVTCTEHTKGLCTG